MPIPLPMPLPPFPQACTFGLIRGPSSPEHLLLVPLISLVLALQSNGARVAERIQHRFLAPGLTIVATPYAPALSERQGRVLDGLQTTHDDTENTTDLRKEDERVEAHLGDDLCKEVIRDDDDKPLPFVESTI